MNTKIYILLVTLFTSLTFMACSDDDAGNNFDESSAFLIGTWVWSGTDAYEITFKKDGKVIWDYKDSRGQKEVSYTYNKETGIVTFVEYRESYKITEIEADKIHIVYIEDNGDLDYKHPETWTKIK